MNEAAAFKEHHSFTIDDLLASLNSSEKGLSYEEAKKRLDTYGKNEIARKERRHGLAIFLSQFKSPLVLILIFASVIAQLLGEITNSLVILGIVLLNSVLGFVQEYKAEKTLRALRKYISLNAKTLRNGEEIEIDAKQLVPGDIVYFNIGDIVPADIRLIDADELSADEASLTGESMPVPKLLGIIKKEHAEPQDLSNMIFMGTTIASGYGKGVVVGTGEKTFFGKTAAYLKTKEEETYFQKSIKKFGTFLLQVTLVMTIFVFIINAVLGRGIFTSFLFALALAVGITPEVLPIIMTITMSKGARAMAKEKVVVKRLASIEDMGNIDILCADKTGTLTEGKPALENFISLELKQKEELLVYGLLCNSALVSARQIRGNPLDVAVWEYAKKWNFDIKKVEQFRRIDESEFDFERKRMSVVVEKNKAYMMVAKGAPESILSVCSKAVVDSKIQSIGKVRDKIVDTYTSFAKAGYRVIAIATKPIKEKKEEYTKEDERDLIFAGFLLFSDPHKGTVKETLEMLKKLQVDLKILTGDDNHVTAKVCREVGLGIVENKIILGSELDSMDEQTFDEVVVKYNVFARITPAQKLRIVKTLSKKGHVVGFLGDGVNDAPALKAVDVGISVDSAVGVAKEAADVILLKKSLRVIVKGIMEGRRTFGNITKYIQNTISANYGNMITLSMSSIFLKFIPLLPAQVLLVNFCSDAPLLSISTDNVDEEFLKKPKKWNIEYIAKFMNVFGLISSIFDFAVIILLVFVLSASPALFRTAWFLESVLSEIVITFAIRTRYPFFKSKPSKTLLVVSLLTIVATIFLIYSPLGLAFEFEKMTPWFLGMILLIVGIYFATTELAKRWFFKKYEF